MEKDIREQYAEYLRVNRRRDLLWYGPGLFVLALAWYLCQA